MQTLRKRQFRSCIKILLSSDEEAIGAANLLLIIGGIQQKRRAPTVKDMRCSCHKGCMVAGQKCGPCSNFGGCS